MNSRNRVLNAIEHKEVDRVPIDLGMHFSTGISAFAYYNLREYLGLPIKSIEMVDMVQCLARVDDDILEMFHIDTKLLVPKFRKTKIWQYDQKYSFYVPHSAEIQKRMDGGFIMTADHSTLKMPKGGFFFDGGWPSFHGLNTEEWLSDMAFEAEKIYKDSDYFTCFMQFGAFFGDVDWLCRWHEDPDEVKKSQEEALENAKKYAGKVISKLGRNVQAVALNSDMGTQNGPMCNPELYNEFVAPYLKEFCTFIKNNSDYKIFLHSCGSIEPFIDTLIDCKIDVLNPVQISANNMAPKQLKDKYGDRICFWGGGCNTQQVLNIGTAQDVKNNVRELMEIFAKRSGFVFNQVHNIMGDIKPENIVAMLDAAYEYSFMSNSL